VRGGDSDIWAAQMLRVVKLGLFGPRKNTKRQKLSEITIFILEGLLSSLL
jgi:hypothetical protein